MAAAQQAHNPPMFTVCTRDKCPEQAKLGSHTILEHFCNTCKKLGHTADRCGKPQQHREEFETLADNLKHTLLHRMQNCKSTYASLNECRIEGCKYPKTHLTVYHTCGKCSKMGHNTRLCGLYSQNQYTHLSTNDFMDPSETCNFKTCEYYIYHTTPGHYCADCKTHGGNKNCIVCMHIAVCNSCKLRGTHIDQCNEAAMELAKLNDLVNRTYNHKLVERTCSVCKTHNVLDIEKSRIFSLTDVLPHNYDEMVEHINKDGADQSAPSSANSEIVKPTPIKVSEACCICKTNYADVVFPKCRHIVCCSKCLLAVK